MRISYSALETFNTCPAKYKFQYLDQIKAPKLKEAVFGTLIHECLKAFHNPSRLALLTQDELLKSFSEKWDSNIYTDKQEEAFAFHQGIEILKNYHLQNQGISFNIIDLETFFSAPILEEQKGKQEFHQITGRIDRIDKLADNSFELIDYKTAKKMPSQDEVNKNFQLSVYHLGAINRWPSLEEENRPVKLSLYFLKHGEKISSLRTSQQIEQSKETILSLIKQIRESDFGPRSNPLCPWCQYQSHCPLFKHKFIKEQSPAPDQEKINQVIREYFEIKNQQEQGTKRLTELKTIINQYCDVNGVERVFGEDGYITRLPQQRFTYDFNKVKEILEPIGKWNAILTIDKTKFKKVVDALSYDLKKQIDQAKTLEREFKVMTASKKIQ